MKHKCAIILTAIVTTVPFSRAQSTDEKALDSFRRLVSHHVDSYKEGRVHVTELGGGWTKERFILVADSAKFDVEKTSSLMSPFIGTLTFTLVRRLTAFHTTEADAAADTTFVRETSGAHKHLFAYQDHKWCPTDRHYKDSLADGFYPCDEFLLKKEKPSEKDIHGCLEEFDDQ